MTQCLGNVFLNTARETQSSRQEKEKPSVL